MRWNQLVISLIFFTVCSIQLFGQDEAVRRRQKAIFIYNIMRQVTWENEAGINTFQMGVLGDNQIIEDLNLLKEKGRRFRGRPIVVNQLNSIDDLRGDIHLVYVNESSGVLMAELLEEITGDNVLIVSEGYRFNESMINIIEMESSYQFEINLARMELEKFEVANSLSDLAVSSADRWMELYLNSKESLEEEREKVAKQESLISQQETRIRDQVRSIRDQNEEVKRLKDEFKRLSEENVRQGNLFKEREEAIDSVEQLLEQRQSEAERRKVEIERLDRILIEQMNLLAEQEGEIGDQKEVLAQQRQDLNVQRKFTILFIILTISTITAGFFIWRNYRIKKKSNDALALKNEAIEEQARELEAQSREMEQFAYVASHDLQEPLNTITSIVNVVNKDQLDDVGKQSIQFIYDSAERMRQLIRGLLEYSQLGRDVSFDEVDCNKLMRNVQANLSKVIEDTDTTLEIGAMPMLTGHEVELSLLFQNLISNAIKFRSEGRNPLIKIQARKLNSEDNESKRWQFEVHDNGIGIDDKFKEKIFVIFKRLHSRSQYKGTGIGLAHCQKIVDLHGGKIWVNSTVGEGSTFYFTLEDQVS